MKSRSEVMDKLVASAGSSERQVLLAGGHVVTMTNAGTLRGDVLFRGSTILDVGTDLSEQVGEETIVVDVADCGIIPGLVDSHLHAWEGQLRGIAPDVDFGQYMALTHGGFARAYRPEDIAIAQRLSAAQAINAGTTTFIDNSHNCRSPDHTNAAIEALLSTGVRAVFAAGGATAGETNHGLPHDLLRLRDEYFGSNQELVSLRMFDLQPSIESWTFAERHSFDVCAEIGNWVPNLDALAQSGLMRPGHTYNHCAGIDEEVWKAIADSGAAINLSPRSDSHFGLSAFVPVIEANRHGIQEGISSDNELSYGHDLFTEMRSLLLIQRGLSLAEASIGAPDAPDPYTSIDVLRAATVGGALNAGLSEEIGTIEKGKKADLVILKFDQVTTQLWGSLVGNIVNYAGISNVDSVFINGDLKKWGGELLDVDYSALVEQGESSREFLLNSYNISLAEVRTGLRDSVTGGDSDSAIDEIVARSGR